MLEEIIREADRNRATLVEKLLGSPQDGRIKMYVIHRALHFRRNHPELFASGAYVPLRAGGECTRHVIAFARGAGRERVIIAAGRFFTKLERTAADSFPAGAAWSDTRVILPPDFAPRRYVDLFTGCEIEARAQEGTAQLSQLSMDEVFARMPISMLVPSD